MRKTLLRLTLSAALALLFAVSLCSCASISTNVHHTIENALGLSRPEETASGAVDSAVPEADAAVPAPPRLTARAGPP